jgi:hypothetical protein
MRVKRARFKFGRFGVQIPDWTVVLKEVFSEVFLSSPVEVIHSDHIL